MDIQALPDKYSRLYKLNSLLSLANINCHSNFFALYIHVLKDSIEDMATITVLVKIKKFSIIQRYMQLGLVKILSSENFRLACAVYSV